MTAAKCTCHVEPDALWVFEHWPSVDACAILCPIHAPTAPPPRVPKVAPPPPPPPPPPVAPVLNAPTVAPGTWQAVTPAASGHDPLAPFSGLVCLVAGTLVAEARQNPNPFPPPAPPPGPPYPVPPIFSGPSFFITVDLAVGDLVQPLGDPPFFPPPAPPMTPHFAVWVRVDPASTAQVVGLP